MTQQQISVITLGIADLARSRRFYVEGFGWTPVFENHEIVFYQMNGLMLGTWRREALAADMRKSRLNPDGAFSLAHNVRTEAEVEPLLARLQAAGGALLKAAVVPSIGGYSGYAADPYGPAWEIAYNPARPISPGGDARFGV